MAALLGQVNLDWRTPIDPRAFALACNRLAHRAGKARRGLREHNLAITFFDAGTPIDAALAEQPWRARDVIIGFDGWLSNRKRLAQDMDLPAECSTAEVLAAGWRRLGDRLLHKLEGGYALAIIDRTQRSIALARDVMGLRQLVYRSSESQLSFASEEAALLQPDDAINALAVAQYFAALHQLQGGFFSAIHTLPPGGVLLWRDGKIARTQQLPKRVSTPRRMRDADAIAQFRALFAQSEARYTASLSAHNPIAVSLSGGIDSNLVLALSQWPKLAAASWSLPEFASADERHWAAQHAAARGISHHVLRAKNTECLPLLDVRMRRVSLNTPISNIYRELKTAFYRQLQQAGIGMLANGHFGDHGMLDSGEWLAECLSRHDFSVIWHEYRWRMRHAPASWRLWRDPAVRRVLRRMLRARPDTALAAPFWQAKTRALLLAPTKPNSTMDQAPPSHRARQLALNFGHYAAFESAGEAEYSEAFGLHCFSPFRDSDLSAFLCALPAHMVQRHGVKKWLYREALRHSSVPEDIRVREKSASLQPVFDQAIAHQTRQRFQALLFHPAAAWPQFVDAAYVRKIFAQSQRSDSQSALLWQCTSLELWLSALRDAGLAQAGFAPSELTQPF
jgi:asparagine synthetase B (glutamine-hydrolysing)